MARTLEMFEKPRKPRQWLMHVSDSGNAGCCEEEDGSDLIARFACARCKHETDWMHISTVTEAKRGIPCPVCNGMGSNQ